GDAAIQIVNNGTQANSGARGPSVAGVQGETWTVSAYLKGASGTVVIGVVELNSGGSFLANAQGGAITLTDTWTRYTFTRTLANASTAQFRFYPATAGTQAITWF